MSILDVINILTYLLLVAVLPNVRSTIPFLPILVGLTNLVLAYLAGTTLKTTVKAFLVYFAALVLIKLMDGRTNFNTTVKNVFKIALLCEFGCILWYRQFGCVLYWIVALAIMVFMNIFVKILIRKDKSI